MQYGIIRCIKVIRGAGYPFWATFGRRLGVYLGQGHQGAWFVPYICMEAWQIFNIQYQYQYGLILILNTDKSTARQRRLILDSSSAPCAISSLTTASCRFSVAHDSGVQPYLSLD